MLKRANFSEFNVAIYGAAAVTLIATPIWNKDALIVPKVILLFLIGLYLLPSILKSLNNLKSNKLISAFFLICILTLIQLILVVFTSDSPIEQQIYGRTGRGLGFTTLVSLIVISLVVLIYIQSAGLNLINAVLTFCGIFIAGYGISQSYGFDFFGWVSKTNGVVATLGNPNFVSSFIAMTVVPTLVFLSYKKNGFIYQILTGFFLFFGLYRAQSTQGFLTLCISLSFFALMFFWFKRKSVFISLAVFGLVISIIAVMGMLNQGPLSSYLYKVSVQSRGDFWRSAITTINSHPMFGVGLDSFGDYYLKYRDEVAVSHSFQEFTDSSHNYFLDYAVNGGILLSILFLLTILISSLSYLKLQKTEEFNPQITALFTVLLVYISQSIISPMNISLMVWGAVASGALVGLTKTQEIEPKTLTKKRKPIEFLGARLAIVILGCTIIYPYFNVDKLQLRAMQTGNGNLVIEVTKKFPESTVRYSNITRELLNSGLPVQALDLAYHAVKFNPNSPALWALILINQSAPIEERKKAQIEILKLDPLNVEVQDYFN